MPARPINLLIAIAGLSVAWSGSLAYAQAPAGDGDAEQEIGPKMRDSFAILPPNTALTFVVTETISSKKARRGDRVHLALKDDLIVNGQVIVSAETPAVGEVTQASTKGFMGLGGKLKVRMLYFDLDQGPVRLSGALASADGNQTQLATATSAATLGVVFFVTGKTATIPQHTELVVVLDREARIPTQRTGS